MDIGKSFESATNPLPPQAAMLYEKFHVLRHLSEVLDAARKSEYARMAGKGRNQIRGEKWTLVSSCENRITGGRKVLKELPADKAFLLKKSIGQLRSYQCEGWTRRFFDTCTLARL